MQECEAVLTVEPTALEIVAMLGEIETRLQQAGQIREETGVHNALVRHDYSRDALREQRACSRSVDAAPARLASASPPGSRAGQ
jgi:hypothetical protein